MQPIEAIEQMKCRVLPSGDCEPKEAAKFLGKAEKTLAQWRSQGIGPPFKKINGRVRYPFPGLQRFNAAT